MLGGDVGGRCVRRQLELRARHGARVIPPLWERMGRPWEGVWSEKLAPDNSSTAHTCIHEAPAVYPALAELQAVRGSEEWALLHPNQGFGCEDLLQRSHQEGRAGSRIEQGKAV